MRYLILVCVGGGGGGGSTLEDAKWQLEEERGQQTALHTKLSNSWRRRRRGRGESNPTAAPLTEQTAGNSFLNDETRKEDEKKNCHKIGGNNMI